MELDTTCIFHIDTLIFLQPFQLLHKVFCTNQNFKLKDKILPNLTKFQNQNFFF